jgi:hypothetical protein
MNDVGRRMVPLSNYFELGRARGSRKETFTAGISLHAFGFGFWVAFAFVFSIV